MEEMGSKCKVGTVKWYKIRERVESLLRKLLSYFCNLLSSSQIPPSMNHTSKLYPCLSHSSPQHSTSFSLASPSFSPASAQLPPSFPQVSQLPPVFLQNNPDFPPASPQLPPPAIGGTPREAPGLETLRAGHPGQGQLGKHKHKDFCLKYKEPCHQMYKMARSPFEYATAHRHITAGHIYKTRPLLS